MPKRTPQQDIKVKDYGEKWINDLAATLVIMSGMAPDERAAVLRYLKSKYAQDWPSDTY